MRAVRILLILGSTLLLLRCQTFDSSQASDKELLATQRSIVANLIDSGQPAKALAELRPLMLKYPGEASLEALLGLTQMALKNASAAVTSLSKAYALEPSGPHGISLSGALIMARRPEAALSFLAELEKTDHFALYEFPERLHHNRGRALQILGQTKAAEASYQKALDLNPTHYLTLLEMARLKKKSKRIRQAQFHLSRATRYCPVCVEGFEELAKILLDQGRYRDASKLLQQFATHRQTDPADVVRLRPLRRLADRFASAKK